MNYKYNKQQIKWTVSNKKPSDVLNYIRYYYDLAFASTIKTGLEFGYLLECLFSKWDEVYSNVVEKIVNGFV